MISSEFVKDLVVPSDSKIFLLVIDGLGGLPHPDTGKTELEMAKTPNMDKIAKEGQGGLTIPIERGITPGSGLAHLALFGYDSVKHKVGRGAVAAVGVGLGMDEGDVAARVNFATVDDNGTVTDRRAGRIATTENARLCEILRDIEFPHVRFVMEPVKDHRAVIVFKGEGLSPELTDTDPQEVGLLPKKVQANSKKAERTAQLVNSFVDKAKIALKDQHPANMILMRGFDTKPHFLPMSEVYGLKGGAIATYPDYLGVARMVGMEVISTGPEMSDEFEALKKAFNSYDFIYLHVKKTDSFGEDGNFAGKVEVIEEIDSLIPEATGLNPDVIMITGDHSTPATLKIHSWHPVPFTIKSRWCRKDGTAAFSETECAKGLLGTFPATEVMSLALAHAGRLMKFGA